MLILTNDEHITNLNECGLMPTKLMQYLTSEYKTLRASLHHEEVLPFSLEEHGYQMAVLQSGDESLLPFKSRNSVLPEVTPEYVELIHLSDEVSMYRACLMLDNEGFVLVYALVGGLQPMLEQWFAHHAGTLTGEGVQ